jgi:hypothetical protein
MKEWYKMIELGLHENPIELMDDIEFYTNFKSGLRLKEQQVDDLKISLFFDCLEQTHEARVLIDSLDVIAPLSRVFERTALVKFRAWTDIYLPAWYYITDLVIEKNQDESVSLWQARFKVTVSLKEK